MEKLALYLVTLLGFFGIGWIALWALDRVFSRTLRAFRIYGSFIDWLVRRGRCVDCNRQWAWGKDVEEETK